MKRIKSQNQSLFKRITLFGGGESIGYIKYIFKTAWFNLVWFKWHLGADIKVFEKCGWQSYKESIRRGCDEVQS